MSNSTRKNSPVKLLMVLFIFTATSIPTQGLIARKLDDTGGVDKCGSCPCNNPCPQNPPPSPPPPSLPPPPPPPPKKPPTPSAPYCPPPPPPPYAGFIYVNGPPGNLYPIDPFPNNGGERSFAVGALPSIVCGLVVGLLAFW